MQRLSTTTLLVLTAIVIVIQFAIVAEAIGSTSFNENGYPTITIVGGTFLILLVFVQSGTVFGMGGWVNDVSWFFIELFLYFAAVNFACGPDAPAARAAIIGMQLMLQVALGIFTIYSRSHYGAFFYIIIAVFNVLCLMGDNFLFNHNTAIWLLDTTLCNGYFGTTNLDRCSDNGFLEWLRVLGNVTILVEFAAIVMAVRAYVVTLGTAVVNKPYDNVGQPVPAVGGPAVGGPIVTGGPAYQTQQTY